MSELRNTVPEAVLVQVMATVDGGPEEVMDAAVLLQEDLLDLDVTSVAPLRRGEMPDGSKGGLAEVAGWLAINLGPAALRVIVNRVVTWATQSGNSVEISIGGDVLKVSGVSDIQQERLIDDWLARHPAIA